jgi:Holliday junction resolvase-like predicted endonuclease
MLESDIESYLVKTVRSMGGEAYKFNSLSHRGVSDRIVCLPDGATWFIEVKTDRGKLSALQKIFAQDMKRMNQRYACLWNKEQVDRWAYEITTVSR